ncbi:hypothetical protein ACX9R5_04675 [Rathayibacter sp. CAU 1779]
MSSDGRPFGSELTSHASGAEVSEYIGLLRSQGRYRTRYSPLGTGILVAIQAGLGVVLLGVAGVMAAFGVGLAAVGVVLVFGVLFLVWAVTNAVKYAASRKDPARWLHLQRFADANGLEFSPSVPNPDLPGIVFQQGWGRIARQVLRATSGRFVEYANYEYRIGDKNNYTVNRWGYVAIRLDRPLPNVVLDGKRNNSLFGTNLPERFRSHQRLSLEGDFDRYFTLYCPAGYEADALYLFTPDIMARFIDNAAPLDVEIVDDWLLLYGQGDLVTLDPQIWQRLFSLVASLEDKFAQWGRWHDERADAGAPAAAPVASSDASVPAARQDAPAGTVAPEGQRLVQRSGILGDITGRN